MFLLLCACAVRAEADWGQPEEEDVVVLTPANFDSFLRQYDEVLVYFYLPNCVHCHKFDKFYPALALQYKEADPRVPFAKFNCKHHVGFCAAKGIPTYPYIKLYIREHPLIYYGSRTRNALREFVANVMERTPLKVTIDQLEVFSHQNKPVVVLIGSKSKTATHTLDLMCKYDKEAFFLTIEASPELEKHFLFENIPRPLAGRTIIFAHDRPAEICAAAASFDGLENCLFHFRHASLLELGPEFEKLVKEGPQRWAVLFTAVGNAPEVDDFDTVARDFKRKMKFVLASEDSAHPKLVAQLRELLLVDDSFTLPQVRVFDTAFMLLPSDKYRLNQPFSQNSLRQFLAAVLSKSIEPYILSESLENVAYGKIRALSGDSFKAKVLVEGQDSVILYHDDFEECAESKRLLDLLTVLAEDKKYEGVQFFAINGRKNEIGVFQSGKYPAVLLFGKKDLTRPRYRLEIADEKELRQFVDSRKTIVKDDHLKTIYGSDL